MPYNKEGTLLYIHLPRTGGTSIEEAYNLTEMRSPTEVPSPQHLIASEVKKKVGTLWDTAFKFSLVRDPIQRLRSEFGWRLPPKPTPFGFKLENTEQSFNDFLLYAQIVVKKGKYDIHTFDHFRPQVEFLDEPLDKVFTDIVQMQLFFQEIGYPLLPHLNHAPSSDDIMSERNINLIKKIYAKDFERISALQTA